MVYKLVSELDDLSPAALRTALTIVRELDRQGGELPIDNWLDAKRAADTAETVHRIHRLAAGQSTANVAHANLTDDERREYLARLRGETPPI